MSNTTKSVQWVTVADAVSLLGTSKRTLFRMIAAGKINTINEGTKRLVEVRPVEASAEAEPVETRIGMLALTKSNEQLQTALTEARAVLRDAETRTARAHSTAMRWAAAAATLALAAGITGTTTAWQHERANSATSALDAAQRQQRQLAQDLAQAQQATSEARDGFNAILAGWVVDSTSANTSATIGTMARIDCEGE